MRILILATDAYGGHGGIAQHARDLAGALEGHEVVMIPRVVRAEIRDIPAHVRFVAEAARGPLSYLRAIAKARLQPFDRVICTHINLLPVAPKGCVLVVHGIEAWTARRTSLDKCRAVLAVSEVTLGRLLAWSRYKGRTHVVPNAIRLEQYGMRAKRADLVERYGLAGKRVLLTVGRLDADERSKGFDEVLDVLGELPEDVVYMIAGGGNDFPRLQQRAAGLGLSHRVIFTGLFDESDKTDLYNLADVYVMPSRGEGFGFVFLEALACGVPCIGSRIDGGREALLEGELGLLVDPTNPAEIRAAILEQLRAPHRVPERLSFFAFEKFRERVRASVLEE
jgi:phosphatidylinositol alpha-1,6-mannosyltransferase